MYMKIWILSVSLLLSGIGLGQNVPKYVLVEHFTNTWCPICASRNPDLNALIQKYSKNVHHVSIHPPYPYSGCPLYQYNKPENQDRANFYKINGSPSVVVNGGSVSGGIPLLSENSLKTEIAKTSPVSIQITETKNGNARNARVTIKTTNGLAGNYKLFAMVVEKNLRFTASNGELDHYNVFRKFLTSSGGDNISVLAGEQKFDFNFNDDPAWKSEEIYVLAFVQNAATNEVLNSGTKFDILSTPTKNTDIKQIKVYPTMAYSQIYIDLKNDKSTSYEIFNIQGQSINKGVLNRVNQTGLSVNSLSQGVYWLRLHDGVETYMAKFVKG